MEERPPFNLDLLLGPEHVRHYLRFINGADRSFAELGTLDGRVERDEDVYRWADPPEPGRFPQAALMLVGAGPDAASASGALALCPEICWDVCGYYRRLGVSWKATRRQLRVAAFARGFQDRDIVYAIKQLLNRDLRRAYDRMPLGGLFMPDRDVQRMLKRQAIRMAARESAAGETVTAEDVLARMGMSLVTGSAGEDEAPSSRRLPAQEALPAGASETLGSTVTDWDLEWSFWIGPGRLSHESEGLPAWQRMLARAFRAAGCSRASFAVGLFSGPGFSVEERMPGGSPIILLGAEPPDPALARKAVREIMARETTGDQICQC